MNVLLSFWHFAWGHSYFFAGYLTWAALSRLPPYRRYRRRVAEKRYLRRLYRPGQPDGDGWCPRTNYRRH